MPSSPDERAQRVRLMEQQLREQEVVDGLFDVRVDRLVAVTSERLMILSGGGPKGWSQLSIPWRMVTGAQVTSEDGAGPLTVEYTRARGRTSRNAEEVLTVVREELQVDANEDGQRMSSLIAQHVS